jgi:Xaa-Pro aminopeptidase
LGLPRNKLPAMNTSEKLSSLRSAMKSKNIDAYIIPSTDPHLGEYVPEHWHIITWLTGFTGSSATVFITDSIAGLWTDSRYYIQAESQLRDSGFILFNPANTLKHDLISWIAEMISDGCRIGFDDRIFSIETVRKLENSFEHKHVSFDVNCDLIYDLWSDRPPMPYSLAFDHSTKYCGKERSEKIAEVRHEMAKKHIDYHLLTSVDDIMWLLNIRGNDIKYSPLIISFAVVSQEQILLFADEGKIPLKLASEFDKLEIVILPYEETAGIISTLSRDSTLLLNPATTSSNLFNAVPLGMNIIEDISIPTRLKATKNKVEIENIMEVMIEDGVTLTKFFFWLEHNSDAVSEVSLGSKLDLFREENENFLEPSFSTIVAFNDHGALPHYSATNESDYLIEKGILLIDSGGQYLGGTTDITRTVSLGKPAQKQKRDFSLVLKGHAQLALAKFPGGTRGSQLDILARKPLWENGLNYGHGTGHGVGFCLNVHEGPPSISPATGSDSRTTIQPGMLISNEPAIYREGEYGIRIENLMLCSEDFESESGKFLKFETVSLCYIDKSLVDVSLLEQKELDWLNSYHAEVYEKLSPFLTGEERLWLKEKTSAL